ncbi:hypothetical protein [Nocardioides limicola]|nr:hypothetical protein [Nocardioides sp. DJM-14]
MMWFCAAVVAAILAAAVFASGRGAPMTGPDDALTDATSGVQTPD